MKQANRPSGQRRTHGLKALIVAPILAIVLGGAMIVGFATWKAAQAVRHLSTERLAEEAATTGALVRGDVETRLSMLKGLALAVARAGPVAVTDIARGDPAVDGELHFVDGPAARAALVARGLSAEWLARDATDPRDAVSNLFVDRATQRPTVAVRAPLPQGGAHAGSLVLLLPPERLIPSVAEAATSRHPHLTHGVIDGNGRVVARSSGTMGAVGVVSPDHDALRAAIGDRGTFEAAGTNDVPHILSFVRSVPARGWAVVVGEDRAAFNHRALDPIVMVLLSQGVILLLILLSSFWVARLVRRPILALADESRRVAEDNGGGGNDGAGGAAATGDAPPRRLLMPPSTIREFETLRTGLEDAQIALERRREAEREALIIASENERRYRALVHVSAMAFYRVDSEGRLLSMDGWSLLTGRRDATALGRGWMKYMHPEDIVGIQSQRRGARENVQAYDLECRVLTRQRTWRWVRARGVPITGTDGVLHEWFGVLEDIHDRKLADARIMQLAHYDALTGLNNRPFFHQELATAIQQADADGEVFALHLIDLDNFKDVNDFGGHDAGDAVLKGVAVALRSAWPNHLIARLGGDEFVILQYGVVDQAAAQRFGDRILKVVESVASQHTVSGHMRATVGFAMFPDHGRTVEELLRHADLALYNVKKDGGGIARGFSMQLVNAISRRRELAKDLRLALEAGAMGLAVHFQPQVRVEDEQVDGFEALARWTHPRYGPVAPDIFIPIAEEAGLVEELGRWILREACRTAMGWDKGVRVAVNLSAVQVIRDDLPALVQTMLLETGLAARRLELEVTETLLIRDDSKALHVLRRLKALGVKVAMDDFGIGFSSLAYLHNFPFDRVKIDRTFVHDLPASAHAEAIIRSIIGLGEALDFEVLAEGIETRAQLDILKRLGCGFAQGYLFGRPAPADALFGTGTRTARTAEDAA